MAAFQRYIGVDYSGAGTPDSRQSGLRVYLAEETGKPKEKYRFDYQDENWSRRDIAKWLAKTLEQGPATLVGIDHAFSFPELYFNKYGLSPDWPTFLEDFQRHWPTDENHVTVGMVRKGLAGKGSERKGDKDWFRLCEKRSGSAKSVFRFDIPGQVAPSTHAGLPWLLFLRKELGKKAHFWPFDGWTPPAGVSVVAEVYPSLWRHLYPIQDHNKDQHDAYCVAAWLKELDGCGLLKNFFDFYLTDLERQRAEYEGWILGVR